MTDEQQKSDPSIHPSEKRITNLAWGLVIAGAVAGIGGFGVMVASNTGSALERLAAYGSFLQGAVGSLWALAGLLFIYVTFLAQKRQLRQQDAELEDQKVQFQKQQDSMERQSFENTFFQLLRIHDKITAALVHEGA